MSSNGGRTGPAWEHACAILWTRERAKPPSGRTCGLCGRIVDLDVPYRNPATGKVNRRSKSANHITPKTNGGALYDPDNLELSHLECQWKQGGELRHAQDRRNRRKRRRRNATRTSRDW